MTNRIDQIVRKEMTSEHLTSPRLMPLKKAADHLGLTVWALRERIWAGAKNAVVVSVNWWVAALLCAAPS